DAEEQRRDPDFTKHVLDLYLNQLVAPHVRFYRTVLSAAETSALARAVEASAPTKAAAEEAARVAAQLGVFVATIDEERDAAPVCGTASEKYGTSILDCSAELRDIIAGRDPFGADGVARTPYRALVQAIALRLENDSLLYGSFDSLLEAGEEEHAPDATADDD